MGEETFLYVATAARMKTTDPLLILPPPKTKDSKDSSLSCYRSVMAAATSMSSPEHIVKNLAI